MEAKFTYVGIRVKNMKKSSARALSVLGYQNGDEFFESNPSRRNWKQAWLT